MECGIRKHDNYQFEIKVAYPLERHRERMRYEMELYVFLPYPLQLGPETCSREEFYDDLLTYTRFKTPEISLKGLLDDKIKESPLTRIARLVARGKAGHGWDTQRFVYELKVLVRVVRVQLRDRVSEIRSVVRRSEPSKGSGPWVDSAEEMLSDLGSMHLV